MSTKIFPVALMFLDLGAAIVYAYHQDWMRFGYWISATAITFFATF